MRIAHNARTALAEREGEVIRVRARYARYGHKYGQSVMLEDVRLATTGKSLTDHLWVFTSGWVMFGTRLGDTIELSAEVAPYVKGWLGEPYSRRGLEAPSPSLDCHLEDIRDAAVVEYGPIVRMLDDGSIVGRSQS